MPGLVLVGLAWYLIEVVRGELELGLAGGGLRKKLKRFLCFS